MALLNMQRILTIALFCMIFNTTILNAFVTDNHEKKGENNRDEDDDTSKAIEAKGKSIDELSSLIEHSTDNMEDEIEKAGKAIDSPEAEKRIEIAGKGVDDLAAEMEEKTEKEGEMIENAMKTVITNDDKELDKDGSGEKAIETGDKHEKVHSKPKYSSKVEINSFERQEKLRQKMEDLVEKQGDKVEEIGNEIEKSRRNDIQKKVTGNTVKLKTKRFQRKNKSGVYKQRNIKKKDPFKQGFINKNASKRRVIIPVNRKKLEKLMLYYYVHDKMKSGELNPQNLDKFFDRIKQLPLEEEKPKKKEVNLLNFMTELKDNEEKTEDEDSKQASKLNTLEDFKGLLEKFLKNHDKKEEEKRKENEGDLGLFVKYLGSKGVTRGSTPIGTPDEDEPDREKLKEIMGGVLSEKSKNEQDEKKGEEISVDQVHKMLDKIRNINETIFAMEKKKHEEAKEESKKKCKEENCVGRALISMLDDALKAVNQAKSGNEDTKVANNLHDEKKVTGTTRSKSDPYAGIGFLDSSEKNGETDDSQDVKGLGRHLKSHSVDVIGTSHPVGMLSERAHMRYIHDDDDGDDDDDDDDDEDDRHHYFHHRPMIHGAYFPLPIPHHMHHAMHDINDHYDDSHHSYFGGHLGYHGHTMPIRTNYHHDDSGYIEPLNVDTAPMPEYPSRHVHDHVDVDALLRGHPYNYHHHTPDIALEGPISTAPVYQDMHHILNGPGIHDQPDVHYEVEMHAHPYHHEDHHRHDDDDDGHDDEGDHGYHHHNTYHHGDSHGDKKHVIEKTRKKLSWRKSRRRMAQKPDGKRLHNKTALRLRRNEDDDDDDDEEDDVEIEKVPRNGHGVARLSYLTQRNGEEMQHAINEKILDVEDVGRSIEEKVQRGVDRVTEISNHEVEAPDYDTEGHMEPTIHREDIEQEDYGQAYKKDKIKQQKVSENKL